MDTNTIDVQARPVAAIAPTTPAPLAANTKVLPVLPPTRGELRQYLALGHNLGWCRPFVEVHSDLLKPLPPTLISWLPGKSNKRTGRTSPDIPFISWPDANMILDFIAPGWEVEFDEGQLGDRCTIRCKLTLHCAEKAFTRSSLGSEGLEDEAYGGPLPDAESQAFRRAAAKFGLGLYLYDETVRAALLKYRNRHQ